MTRRVGTKAQTIDPHCHCDARPQAGVHSATERSEALSAEEEAKPTRQSQKAARRWKHVRCCGGCQRVKKSKASP